MCCTRFRTCDTFRCLVVTREFIDKYKCKCNRVLTLKKNKGYANLMSHVKTFHPEFKSETITTQKTFDITDCSKERIIYGWLTVNNYTSNYPRHNNENYSTYGLTEGNLT